MKNVVLLRKEYFGGTLFNSTTGKRTYITKQEYKDIMENKVSIYNYDIVDENCNIEDIVLKVTENANSNYSNIFSFADTVYIELTRNCNLFCKHCLNNSGKKVDNELTKQEVIDLINELSLSGVQEIRFTGGEPLLFKGIYEIINCAHNNGLRTSLGTNATLITKDIAFNLKKSGLNNAVVSLDGTPKIHDSIRGKGNFEKSMRGLNYLIETGIDVRVNSVIMKNNIKEVIELAKLLNKQGIKLFIRQFLSTGRGKNLENYSLNSSEYKDVKKILSLELSENVQGHNLKNNNGTVSRIPLEFEISSCRAGQRTMCITPEGNIFPCGFLASQGFSPLGNVRNVESFCNFWHELGNNGNLLSIRKEMKKYNETHEEKIKCMAEYYGITKITKEENKF